MNVCWFLIMTWRLVKVAVGPVLVINLSMCLQNSWYICVFELALNPPDPWWPPSHSNSHRGISDFCSSSPILYRAASRHRVENHSPLLWHPKLQSQRQSCYLVGEEKAGHSFPPHLASKELLMNDTQNWHYPQAFKLMMTVCFKLCNLKLWPFQHACPLVAEKSSHNHRDHVR